MNRGRMSCRVSSVTAAARSATVAPYASPVSVARPKVISTTYSLSVSATNSAIRVARPIAGTGTQLLLRLGEGTRDDVIEFALGGEAGGAFVPAAAERFRDDVAPDGVARA